VHGDVLPCDVMLSPVVSRRAASEEPVGSLLSTPHHIRRRRRRRPPTGYSSYAASKWALRGMADCLRNELLGTGVEISVAYPPDTGKGTRGRRGQGRWAGWVAQGWRAMSRRWR
jgi:NAD(P)-dependent dehydrogenase (short-subunit alcohol dehydrogenase family)